MERNPENLLDALNDFQRKPTEIPPILEEYLLRVAKNGEIVFPWCMLKPLLKRKLELVLDEFYESCPVEINTPVPNFETFNFDTLKKSILQAVEAFTSTPFTIQRLCELVTNPKKHYNRTDKYMRGIEKNVLVVSTVEPRTGAQGDGINANLSPVVNGMVNDSPRDDNDCFNGHENTDVSTTNLNSSSNHVLLENFANVFPSAACIPSASNICINREMDETYRIRRCSDLAADEDIDLPSLSNSEESESVEDADSKDEVMDTTEEIETFSAADSDNDALSVVSKTEEPSSPPNKTEDVDATKKSEEHNSEPPLDNCVSASEDLQQEADCSESSELIFEKEQTESSPCHQDDTISQSDDSSHNVNEASQSDEPSDSVDSPPDQEVAEISTEISQSTAESDSSNQCMDESSTESGSS